MERVMGKRNIFDSILDCFKVFWRIIQIIIVCLVIWGFKILLDNLYPKNVIITYKEAQILSITQSQNDNQFNLILKTVDDSILSLTDVNCKIVMGDYNPKAYLPYCKYDVKFQEYKDVPAWNVWGIQPIIKIEIPNNFKFNQTKYNNGEEN